VTTSERTARRVSGLVVSSSMKRRPVDTPRRCRICWRCLCSRRRWNPRTAPTLRCSSTSGCWRDTGPGQALHYTPPLPLHKVHVTTRNSLHSWHRTATFH